MQLRYGFEQGTFLRGVLWSPFRIPLTLESRFSDYTLSFSCFSLNFFNSSSSFICFSLISASFFAIFSSSLLGSSSLSLKSLLLFSQNFQFLFSLSAFFLFFLPFEFLQLDLMLIIMLLYVNYLKILKYYISNFS